MANTGDINWPSSAAASNPSIGTNGSTAPTSSTQIAGKSPSGKIVPVSVDESGVENVNVSTSVLPTGASTSALQTSGNVSLASIDSKLPALGQASDAASIPVVLPVDQLTTLTPPTTVTVIQPTGTNLHATIDNVSIAITAAALPLPAGASTSANQTSTLGTVVAGTAATKSTLIGGIFNTTPPTLTTGQGAAVQVDSNARIILGTSTASVGTVNQGTAAVTANAWPAKITDGTNTSVVKAASTIVATTDTALVVGLSPNTPAKIYDGTNTATVKAASTAAVATDTALVVAVSPNNTLITNARQTGTLTDRSGTTSATPSTSTQVAAANSSRKYFIIQNVHASNIIWINFTSAATLAQPSIQLNPGSSYVMESGFITTEVINVICSAASSPFAAKEG